MVPDLLAAGKFSRALQVLEQRIGLVNKEPLLPLFRRAALAAHGYLPTMPFAQDIEMPLLSPNCRLADRNLVPRRVFDLSAASEVEREGQKSVTLGDFPEALRRFRAALQQLAVTSADNAEQEREGQNLVDTVRNYVTGMRLLIEAQKTRQKGSGQEQLGVELAAYCTCCSLRPLHEFLVLTLAMTIAYKAANYLTAASFAKRLLNGGFETMKGSQKNLESAQKILAEQRGTDAHRINYELNSAPGSVRLCCASLTRIGSAEATTSCPFCRSLAKESYLGSVCPTCNLAEFGRSALGVQFARAGAGA
eukprot:GHVU01023375.1.p1 GENE.GHVU01023375.1~~GHVU01023375.1.p1  ORF type:complete len:307 (+),score=54.86 GHVU01023375.1:339-1259(+)